MAHNPRFQRRGDFKKENVKPLIVAKKEDVVETDADLVELEAEAPTETNKSEQHNEPVKQEEKNYTGKEYLTFTKGTFRHVFRSKPDGSLELVKTIPLTLTGAPARRRFKLRPIPTKMRGQMYETTYHYCPREGIGYKFVQRNGEWDKVKDPRKETIVSVDDETALMLETMNDRFEEVFEKK